MYRILFIILFPFLIFLSIGTNGAPISRDTVPTVVPQLFGGKYYKFNGYILVDSFVMTAAGDTNNIPYYPSLKFKSSDNRWYGYDRSRWQKFLFPGDTASLSNRIDLRVKYSDTALMLSNYVNQVGYGLIKNGQVIRADTGTTGLATQYDLTQLPGKDRFSELLDVTVTTPKNGQRPVYDSITSKWVNRYPPIYNAKDYGAIGDSSTDDRAAILKALQAIPSTGGVLFFPAGRYRVTDSILVPSYVTIRGVGHAFPVKAVSGTNYPVTGDTLAATTFIYNSADKPLFVVKPSSPFTRSFYFGFEEIGIVNLSATTPTDGSTAIKIYNGIGFKIDKVLTAGFYKNITIIGGFQYTITRSTIFAPIHTGLDIGNILEPDAGDFLIDDCVFSTNGIVPIYPRFAIYWHGGGGMKMSNCKFNGTAPHGSVPMFRYDLYFDMTDGSTSDLSIVNCSMENFDSSAIVGRGASNYFRHINITGVQIDGNGNTGSAIDIDQMDDIAISNCVMTSNGGSIAFPAIKLTTCADVRIGSNTIDDYTSKISYSGCTNIRISPTVLDQLILGSDATSTLKVFVSGNGSTTPLPEFHYINTEPSSQNRSGGVFSSGNATMQGVVYSQFGIGSGVYGDGSGYYIGTQTNNDVKFISNNTIRSRLFGNGNIAINQAADNSEGKLQLTGDMAQYGMTKLFYSGYNNPFTFGGALPVDLTSRIIPNSGAALVMQGFGNNASTSGFRMQGHVGSASPTAPAILFEAFKLNGSDRTAMVGADKVMSIYTGDIGTGTEVFEIRGSGEVNIGNMTDQGSYTLQNTGGFYQNGTTALNLGSDANYDIYYRNSGGTLSRLPAGTDGKVLTTHSTSSAPTWESSSIGITIESGRWLPTATGVTNVDAVTIDSAMYTRIGDIVTYSVEIVVDPTANTTLTELRFTLPIASNLTANHDLVGSVSGRTTGTAAVSGTALSDTTNEAGFVQFISQSINNHTLTISGQYKITPP